MKRSRMHKTLICALISTLGLFLVVYGTPVSSPSDLSILQLLEISRTTLDDEALEVIVKALEVQKPQTSEETNQLIKALNHPRLEVQRAAALALGNGKVKQAVLALIDKLERVSATNLQANTEAELKAANQVAFLAEAIVAALANIKDERAIEPLLRHPEFYTLHMGGMPLAAFGAKALPSILSIASNKDDSRHQDVLGIIANMRDTDAVPLLLAALRKDNREVQKSAISALQGMKAHEATPVFEQFLGDSDPEIRLLSLMGLVEVQPEKYFDRALLFLNDRSSFVRSQVINLLARTGNVAAVEPLEKLLTDRDDLVSYSAAKALEKLTGRSYPTKRSKLGDLMEKVSKTSPGSEKNF